MPIATWYSTGMTATATPKDRGVFYTPDDIIVRTLSSAFDALPAPLLHSDTFAVLDPACGDGRFLRHAAVLLKDLAPPRTGTSRLYGADIDASGIAAARASLAGIGGSDASLIEADTLIDNARIAGHAGVRMLPWERKFPLIVGNPPWASLTGKHRSSLYDAAVRAWLMERYPCDRYRTNLFELFLHRSLELLAPEGVLAFVLPDRLIHNRQYRRLCEGLAARMTITRIVTHVPFAGVTSDNIIIVLLNRTPTANAPIVLEDYPSRKTSTISRSDLLRMHVPSPAHERTLASEFSIATGFIARAGSVVAAMDSSHRVPVIKGADISAKAVIGKHYFTGSKRDMIGGTMDRGKLMRTPRVLVRKTGSELIAVFDETDAIPEQSVYSITHPGNDRNALLSLAEYLNSPAVRSAAKERLTNAGSFPHFKKYDLAAIPLALEGPVVAITSKK